jgi:hypothetical protein
MEGPLLSGYRSACAAFGGPHQQAQAGMHQQARSSGLVLGLRPALLPVGQAMPLPVLPLLHKAMPAMRMLLIFAPQERAAHRGA